MNIQKLANHPIQRRIVDSLTTVKQARFRDLRPSGVDSNLYTYHLNKLTKASVIKKTDAGYTLGPAGIHLVDSLAGESSLRLATPIVLGFVAQNANGDVLLSRTPRQPFIDSWSIPQGSYQSSDDSLAAAAERVFADLFAIDQPQLQRAGSCFVRVVADQDVVYSRQMQIYRFEAEIADRPGDLEWARPHKLDSYQLFPATEEIITRTFFRDVDYFEEYRLEL